ncbi:MAG: phosphate-starvation-inducible PsiE family protein [Candidatus Aminicenantes bacterium]|nr:phosphate-starvation-inducible PsiE family protein [Candidatus Aminicenantes bacterium]
MVIMLEVLWLITDYLKSKTINAEPFVIIGIISAIRKILIVGAHPLESAT